MAFRVAMTNGSSSPVGRVYFRRTNQKPMERRVLKKAVLQAARARLEVLANDLRARIEDLKAVTIGDENAESASQTEHTHGGDVDLMSSLGAQLEHVLLDAERLARIAPEELLDTVQFGAVVRTDQRDLLIGVSLEEFEADGRHYLGVTAKAPLVQALLGLRAGESAHVNGWKCTVQEVC